MTTIAFEYQNGLTPNPINMIREDNGEVFFEIGDCAGRPVVKTRQGSFVSMQSSSISSTFSLSSGNNVGYSKVIKKKLMEQEIIKVEQKHYIPTMKIFILV